MEVQDFLLTNDTNIGSTIVSNKVKIELYDILYKKNSYDETYHFIMSNFGDDKISEMFRLLSRPFIDWSIENNKNIDKLFECNFIITDYSNLLGSNTDPIVLALTVIGKLKDILKEN